jgi:hypothetical protein
MAYSRSAHTLRQLMHLSQGLSGLLSNLNPAPASTGAPGSLTSNGCTVIAPRVNAPNRRGGVCFRRISAARGGNLMAAAFHRDERRIPRLHTNRLPQHLTGICWLDE